MCSQGITYTSINLGFQNRSGIASCVHQIAVKVILVKLQASA